MKVYATEATYHKGQSYLDMMMSRFTNADGAIKYYDPSLPSKVSGLGVLAVMLPQKALFSLSHAVTLIRWATQLWDQDISDLDSADQKRQTLNDKLLTFNCLAVPSLAFMYEGTAAPDGSSPMIYAGRRVLYNLCSGYHKQSNEWRNQLSYTYGLKELITPRIGRMELDEQPEQIIRDANLRGINLLFGMGNALGLMQELEYILPYCTYLHNRKHIKWIMDSVYGNDTTLTDEQKSYFSYYSAAVI